MGVPGGAGISGTDMVAVLESANFVAFLPQLRALGCENTLDLSYVTERDLTGMGMTVIQKRKFLELAASHQHGPSDQGVEGGVVSNSVPATPFRPSPPAVPPRVAPAAPPATPTMPTTRTAPAPAIRGSAAGKNRHDSAGTGPGGSKAIVGSSGVGDGNALGGGGAGVGGGGRLGPRRGANQKNCS